MLAGPDPDALLPRLTREQMVHVASHNLVSQNSAYHNGLSNKGNHITRWVWHQWGMIIMSQINSGCWGHSVPQTGAPFTNTD